MLPQALQGIWEFSAISRYLRNGAS